MRALTVVTFLAISATGACAEFPLGAENEIAEDALTPQASVPALLEPLNTAISQNNPASGCTADSARGSGFVIHFDWTDSASPSGISGYEILAQHSGALYPIVKQIVFQSELTHSSCGFVIDSNLFSWQWRVRAIDGNGEYGEWSEVGVFYFAPCRLADGSACYAR